MPWRTTRWCGLVHGSAPLCPEYGSGASCAWYATCFTAVVRSSLTIARASHPSCSTQRTHLPKDWPRGCSPCSGLSILPLLWAKFKYVAACRGSTRAGCLCSERWRKAPCPYHREECVMWNPPIALTSEEQKRAARTRKTRKFFAFLRAHRHELLDTDFQYTLAQSYCPEPGGQAPVEAGLLALATLLQAYGHVGDRDAVERTVMDKRWQMVLDCLGAEQPPFSQGTLFNFRMRLSAHNLDKALLDRTVALAETTGGFGARQLRAVLDSTPLFGAGRVEDTLNLLGHALRKAVGLTARELGTSVAAVVEDAGLTLVGHSSLKAALDLDWGEPGARSRALGLVLEEVTRWQHWLEQQHALAVQEPPIQE